MKDITLDNIAPVVVNSRIPLTREAIPTLSPDLAVEVLSESNTTQEIDQKLLEYFQSGTRLVWVIDPETRTVESGRCHLAAVSQSL